MSCILFYQILQYALGDRSVAPMKVVSGSAVRSLDNRSLHDRTPNISAEPALVKPQSRDILTLPLFRGILNTFYATDT